MVSMMPRGKGKTHIEVRVETKQLLKEIAEKLNMYYDDVIREALELYRRVKGV